MSVILTMVCDRCSKEEIVDLSHSSFKSEDEIRKAGFQYVHANRKNLLICSGCNNKFKELKGIQEEKAYKEMCDFFKNCEGKDNERNTNGEKNE